MAAAAAAAEPWQAAAPRKRRSAARRTGRGDAVARGPAAQPEADLETVLRRLREAGEDLRISDFWSSALGASAGAQDCSPGESLVTAARHLKCVCYGIGNFATCVIARNQLAFLLLFLEKSQIPRSHCCVYDPLFSQIEVAVLHALGVTVLSENEEGKRSLCGEPTIFYMLHCGTALYNNLLWSNWSVDTLSKLVIIGNSFRGLEERLLTRILQKDYPYVAKVSHAVEEFPFTQTPQYMDVFNDTSVHCFPAQKLQQLSEDTWSFRAEPDYQDCENLEIIRNETKDPSAAGSNS